MSKLTPNPSYSVSMLIELPNTAGKLAAVINALAAEGGNLSHIDLIEQNRKFTVREITVNASSNEHVENLIVVVKDLPDIKLLQVQDRTFEIHKGGKIHIQSTLPLKGQDDLAMAYTPGVGRVCMAIADDKSKVFEFTIKSNTIAIVSDGSAVLGLGNIGPEAAMPVMEGKAMLFKEFAGLDAFPVCLATQNVDEIVETVKRISPVFGGVNLEDISAPRCFEIESRLQKELDIPVFHDDQHGTAIVVLAAMLNALKIVDKPIETVRIVVNGAGAAGVAVARLLKKAGATRILMCDSRGIICKDRSGLNAEKMEFACIETGNLADALRGADVFLGLSIGNIVSSEMVRSMADKRIVFAMANPIPEIQPELVADDVAVMATGRSDYANQINNVLAFPGVLRGALDARVQHITTDMHVEAAKAIAALVTADELAPDFIIPSVFDHRVAPAVSTAIKYIANQLGLSRV